MLAVLAVLSTSGPAAGGSVAGGWVAGAVAAGGSVTGGAPPQAVRINATTINTGRMEKNLLMDAPFFVGGFCADATTQDLQKVCKALKDIISQSMKSSPLLNTKFMPPPRTAGIPRPHLIRWLDAHSRKKLIL